MTKTSGNLSALIHYVMLRDAFKDMDPGQYPKNDDEVIDFDPHQCVIKDGSKNTGVYSIEQNGFEISDCPSTLQIEYSDPGYRTLYARETARIIEQRLPSASTAVTVNTSFRGFGGARPLLKVHNDYNDEFAWRRASQIYSRIKGDHSPRRFDFIQTWRPVSNRVEQYPLAFCDSTTVNREDFITIGHNYLVKYNPNHSWTYFSGMTPGQLLIFRTFCSDENNRTRYTPHTSFVDPSFPEESGSRQSIETRAVVFYD